MNRQKEAPLVIALCVLTLIGPTVSQADTNKSGVQPTVLSLPAGPGSIEGLGESFEPQLNSGTISYAISFAVPPGRAGFAPTIVLQYNGGNGNGPAGLGWRLNLPNLQRQTEKGLPYYTNYPERDGIDNDQDGETDEIDEWDTIIYSNGEELVPLLDGSFRFKNESDFTKFERSGEGWLATRSNGTRLWLGTTTAGQIQDERGRIFRWLLEAMEDTNGNRIEFNHAALDGGYQRYCRFIRYNHDMQVELVYEDRPDVYVDYRPRFPLKTAFRVVEVRMSTGGHPVRSYRLGYAATSDTQPLSLLSSVTQVGRDGTSTLPPAEFSYTTFSVRDAHTVSMPTAPLLSLNDAAIDLLDINADGLPDILDTRDRVHDFYLNLGPGENGVVRWSARTGMSSMPPITLDLSSDDVQLADVDGDGHTDLLKLGLTDIEVYHIRDPLTAPGWESGNLLRQALFNFRNRDTRLVDQNNDKRIDVMRTTASGNVFVWLNKTDNRWSSAFTPALPNPNLGVAHSNVHMADMNGDRLQDLVLMENDHCTWYPARGFGEYGSPIPMDNPPFGVLDAARLLMADVNGDGLSDALYVSGGRVRVWLNLGLNQADHSRGRFARPFTVDAPYTSSVTVFRQADVNGNGSQDLLWNTHPGGGPDTFAYIDFAAGEQPYLLKTFTNGVGLTTTISYRSSVFDWVRDRDAGRPWSSSIPFPVPVIARVEVDDGLATYVTEYQYHDGYYDRSEKEFRGFAAVEQRELGDASAPDLITAYRFDTGSREEALKGRPLEIETRTADGAVFHRENYTWNTRQLAAAARVDGEVIFAFRSQKLRTVIEQGNGDPVCLKWDYEYDDFGNVIRQVEHGRLDTGIPTEAPDPSLQMPPIQPWDDERVTETSYTAAFPSGQARWILGRPVEQIIMDEDGTIAARSRTYYDGSGTLGEVSRGNTTRTENWVEGAHYAVTDRRDYDQHGNVTFIYDALYGSAPGHSRQLIYDDAHHSFPVEERIHTGERILTVTAGYDFGLGTVTESTNFNGHRTTYTYDTFGRLVAITKPLDVVPTMEYDYRLAQQVDGGKLINWVESRQRESADGGTVDVRTFYDGLGRAVMTRAEGEEAGQVVVSNTVEFNARKQPWRKYLPYIEQGTLDYKRPTFASPYTEHRCDALGREVRLIQPDGTFAETRYEPLSRIFLDEEQTNSQSSHYGAATRHIYDGLLDDSGKGRLRRIYEITPEPWLTQFQYDLLDNVTTYIDAQSNRKLVEYDGLGRKRFMNDPDRGHMHWDYDDAGNLLRTQDAKGQAIRYTYDGANRLRAEHHGATANVPDVEYHYDVPAGPLQRGELWPVERLREIVQPMESSATALAVRAENTLGQLAWVRDPSGEEHISYDARGRISQVMKRIFVGNPGKLRNFYGAMKYDSMDRIVKQTYPDSGSVDYSYNDRGLLERVTERSIGDIVRDLDYDPSGLKVRCEYGNGVATTYGYDSRLHLITLETRKVVEPTEPLIHYRFRFDGASNIRRVDDLRPGTVVPEGHPRRNTQIFDYDNLYRLTAVGYSFALPGQPDRNDGRIDYTYDRIGDILSKTSGTVHLENNLRSNNLGQIFYGGAAGRFGRVGRFLGDEPGPHALTLTRDEDNEHRYAYDDNGNMVNMQGIQLMWDVKDRLIGVEDALMRTTYVYDYSDRRVMKLVEPKSTTSITQGTTNETTLYPYRYYELRPHHIPIKYIFAGNIRIARITGSPNAGGQVHYYHQDHLGSTNVIADGNGVLSEEIAFYPFGHPRNKHWTDDRIGEPYLFTQKELDAESGLQYFHARYFTGLLGRFVSVDRTELKPELPQTLNSYSYVSNQPLRQVDPTGNWGIFVGIGGALGLQKLRDVGKGYGAEVGLYLGKESTNSSVEMGEYLSAEDSKLAGAKVGVGFTVGLYLGDSKDTIRGDLTFRRLILVVASVTISRDPKTRELRAIAIGFGGKGFGLAEEGGVQRGAAIPLQDNFTAPLPEWDEPEDFIRWDGTPVTGSGSVSSTDKP